MSSPPENDEITTCIMRKYGCEVYSVYGITTIKSMCDWGISVSWCWSWCPKYCLIVNCFMKRVEIYLSLCIDNLILFEAYMSLLSLLPSSISEDDLRWHQLTGSRVRNFRYTFINCIISSRGFLGEVLTFSSISGSSLPSFQRTWYFRSLQSNGILSRLHYLRYCNWTSLITLL